MENATKYNCCGQCLFFSLGNKKLSKQINQIFKLKKNYYERRNSRLPYLNNEKYCNQKRIIYVSRQAGENASQCTQTLS